MSLLSLPKKYYETEKKPLHLLGYTFALGLSIIGLIETVHSIPYIVKGESDMTGMLLGPVAVGAGLVSATMYLKEAGLDEGY